MSGTAQCESAIRSGKACLVILSEEASDATGRNLPFCKMRNINAIVIGTKQELGGAIGKGSRTLLAITDEAFKEVI